MGRILPRFDFRVEIASESHIGKVRSKNEDALLIAPELALFGVADGMGGLSAGEVASSMAVDAVKDHLASKKALRVSEAFVGAPSLETRREVFDLLRGACDVAHERLRAEQEKRKTQMGTTLDLCLFLRDKAFIAHVGDGRVFVARPRATLQVTEDHLLRDPASHRSPGDARKVPRPLSSGVGLSVPLRADVLLVDVRKGDTVVLASDGAYAPLENEAAVTTACRGAPRAVVETMVRHSLSKGGRDNASVIAIRIEERLVSRPGDRAEHDDMGTVQTCPLFVGLAAPSVLAALSSAVEVEIEEGKEVAPFEAGDLCAYVVLDGVVKIGSGTTATSLGAPALLFAESLVGVERSGPRPVVAVRLRCLRIRRDDFREVAEHDFGLGLALFQRLAGHLARTHG